MADETSESGGQPRSETGRTESQRYVTQASGRMRARKRPRGRSCRTCPYVRIQKFRRPIFSVLAAARFRNICRSVALLLSALRSLSSGLSVLATLQRSSFRAPSLPKPTAAPHPVTQPTRGTCCMSGLLCRPLSTLGRHLTTRQLSIRPPSTTIAMATPVAASAATVTPASSSSTSSASSSKQSNHSHVPECPRFKTISVGDRLYRQQIIPPPGGHSSSFHSSPTSSSPVASSGGRSGTSSAIATSRLPPLDASLLPLVEEVRDETGVVLYRLSVDCEYACMLSSVSRIQREAVEDIERQHRTNILLPPKAPHSHTVGTTNSTHSLHTTMPTGSSHFHATIRWSYVFCVFFQW